jgi:hypothetical protein
MNESKLRIFHTNAALYDSNRKYSFLHNRLHSVVVRNLAFRSEIAR